MKTPETNKTIEKLYAENKLQISYATIIQKVWNIRNSGSLISIMVFFNISCFENNRNIENNNSTSKIPNITLNLVLSHNSLLLERSELFFFSTRWFWRPASCFLCFFFSTRWFSKPAGCFFFQLATRHFCFEPIPYCYQSFVCFCIQVL